MSWAKLFSPEPISWFQHSAQGSPRVGGQSYLDWYGETIPEWYVIPQHVKWICSEVVQRVIDGELSRVILSMPPQHAKSDTITRRLPVFVGENFPGENILLTGYSQRFAEQELSLNARDLAAERGILAANATALDSWQFSTGGKVSVRGVGTPPTGISNLKWVIVDDPIKSREEASSAVLREKVWQWYTGSIVQRFWPETRVIIIATRWHEDDLIGRLKTKQAKQWEIFNLPAIAEANDILGRKEGEALWPREKPKEFLLSQKEDATEYEFEALFQGNPTPRGGTLFQVSKIGRVKVIPAGLNNCLAWDLGATEGGGDYTAGVHIHGPDQDGIFYIDPMRFRHEPSERNRLMRREAERREPRKVRGPQDPGAAGKESAQTFVRLHAGFSVVTAPVSGDKELRAEPAAAQVNGGNVRVLEGEFTDAYIEELRAFPNGKHDDWVDATSDGFAEVAGPSFTWDW